jgi:WD40 repeat protein
MKYRGHHRAETGKLLALAESLIQQYFQLTISGLIFHPANTEIRTLLGHEGEILSVAISPDGQTLVSGSTDDTIKIWNLNTGKEIRTLLAHSSDVNAIAISPNGHLMVSASDDKTIKLWNLNTGKKLRSQLC